MKKTIGILIIFVLLSEQSYATDLKNLVDTAKTKSSSWQSPATGSKYHYSGSYEFTFKK